MYYFCSALNKPRWKFLLGGIAGIWKNGVTWTRKRKKKYSQLPGDQAYRSLRLLDLNDPESENHPKTPPPPQRVFGGEGTGFEEVPCDDKQADGKPQRSKVLELMWPARSLFWEDQFQTLRCVLYVHDDIDNPSVFAMASSVGVISRHFTEHCEAELSQTHKGSHRGWLFTLVF